MAGGENAEFLRRPTRYISGKAVNVWHFLDFPKATVRRENNQGANWLRDNKKFITGTDARNKLVRPGWNVIALDLIKRTAKTIEGDNVTFRVARLAKSAFSTHLRFSGGYNFGDFHNTPNPIWGYFFPYVNPPGGRDGHRNWDPCEDFGHVDFPREFPQFPFVFTGGMNGCAIVITESPLGDNYYRAYHYPNPGEYPHWQDPRLWQYRVLHWFGFNTYGGEELDRDGRPLDYDALVFLIFQRGEWYVCSQLHRLRVEPRDIRPADAGQLKITEISPQQKPPRGGAPPLKPWTYKLTDMPDSPQDLRRISSFEWKGSFIDLEDSDF